LRLFLPFFLGLRLLFLYFGGSGSVAFAYGAYDLADVDGLAFVFGDGLEDAVLLGLDFEVDLIRFELDERLAGLYGFTLLLEPASDCRIGDRLPKLGNVYLSSHCSLFLSDSHSLGAEARTCVSSTACSSSKSCPPLSKADLTMSACSCLWNLAEPWAGLGRGGFPT
jgi:hypothetical protein